jgi:hypothetical protein
MNEEHKPDLPDDDLPTPVSPDDPFMPIVESLLKYPPGSPEFLDALEVAGPAEKSEAQRQIKVARAAQREHQGALRARMDQLLAEYPELADDETDE